MCIYKRRLFNFKARVYKVHVYLHWAADQWIWKPVSLSVRLEENTIFILMDVLTTVFGYVRPVAVDSTGSLFKMPS